MGEYFKSLSAIFPIIVKKKDDNVQILLHRRKNTGYQDGKWDIAASGHADEGETARIIVLYNYRHNIQYSEIIEM